MPQSADKKPERYVGPDGKSKIRMVPVDREIVKKEAAPKVDPVKFAAHLAKNERPKKMTSTQKTLADIRKRADKRANEKYTAPTKAEVDADKKKDRNAQRAAGIKRPSMTPGSLQRKQYSGMMGKLKRESVDEGYGGMVDPKKRAEIKKKVDANMASLKKNNPNWKSKLSKTKEEVNEISRSMKPMSKRFGKAVDAKKFDTYKKHVKKHNVDEPSVRFIDDNPNHPEAKRTMKDKHMAQAVKLYKAAHKESVQEYHHDQPKQPAQKKKPVAELSMSMKNVSKTGLSKKATGSVNKDKLKKDLEKLKKNLGEKLKVSDGMGSWIKDFQASDAPQFKGKDKEERRDMAIAAYLSAKRGN